MLQVGVVGVVVVIVPILAPPRPADPVGARRGSRTNAVALPVPTLTPHRTSTAVYGFTTMDHRGRLASRHVIHALGWRDGLALTVQHSADALWIHPAPDGRLQVTAPGYVWLPSQIRHACRLLPGDGILLAGFAEDDRLIVHPPAALDKALCSAPVGLSGGEQE